MKQIQIILFLLVLAFAHATIINVPVDQPTIQAGITAATNIDTVLVQPGTYEENINYNGKLITVGSLFLTTADTSYISSTIIDGDLNGSVVTFSNSEDSTAVLCGFTITNGYREEGGGILCTGVSTNPILKNLIVTENEASDIGGGLYCQSGNPSIENVIISDNHAGSAGGGIYCSYSSPSLENVTITGNYAVSASGGIECDTASPSLKYVSITNNFAEWGGGGMCCLYGSNPVLEYVTIANNYAGMNDSGGIYCNASNPTLINTILWNDFPAEIYLAASSIVTIAYSDIEGGWGGLGNIDSDPLFVDPTIGDYRLSWTNFPIQDATMSPCIDTGDPAFPLDPDGTRADMGAYYFNQLTPPDAPQNVTVEIIGTDVHLSWDAVTGANSYMVYSSDDPYAGFVEDNSGSFAGESWSAPIGDVKKFYYVIASTETIRSKDSNLQDAYHPDRKMRKYDSDKFIKKVRK